MLNICEIFYSIQGESTFSGLPCVFVRLTGCNLNCTWCDTLYANKEGSFMSIGDIFKEIKSFDCDLVEITGGEPLIQKETPLLIESLISKGYKVLVETNGSINIDTITNRSIRIVDIKCPSSGESKKNLLNNIELLNENDEIKFVIADRTDYEFAKELITKTNLRKINARHIHLSPVYGRIQPDKLASWILNDRLKARLSMQLHKIIWHPEKRGV